ncbi:CHAD domain containing protein [Acidimicrobium ferrooxidans DSM 10331]|uniref:CHAD domain containing protein n=1 Tax=Acidimicrobium ferrooxidans (strain DSM 10331 / JCM 15462 / NBRC 103882 / ICP) TaxID=525909 RepID=C7LYN0_ACIFD|nr:CHAD domain-containing protein [Acidimicrobium ferrooxidans]ACU53838.1 CHAD domain containing protein [Acidimicrobium ferrooxidans DSM 10331]
MRTRVVIDPEVWPSVAAHLAETRAALEELLIALERRTTPDLVHDARAALRRAAVAEALIGTAPAPSVGRHGASPLTRLANQLASVRDLDVAATILPARPDLAAERTKRAERLPELARAARVCLPGPTSTPDTRRVVDLEALVRSWQRRARRAAQRPGMDELHALRRSARRLRLASELLAPIAPATSVRLRRRALALTTHLGRAHDLQIAALLLERSTRSTARLLARRATKLARGWQPLAVRTSTELDGWLCALSSRNSAPTILASTLVSGGADDTLLDVEP